jgi:hypothetical protein
MARRVKPIVRDNLGKAGTLSLKRDVFGVYAPSTTKTRSLKARLDLIENVPFVRVAVVTIVDPAGAVGPMVTGPRPTLQRDLDNANLVYRSNCGYWVYYTGSITVNRPDLLILDQEDNFRDNHCVSVEEDQLFNYGRGLGAPIVGYYINNSNIPAGGRASHPPGRRGFWVGNRASQWTFAHELTHLLWPFSDGSDDPAHSKITNNLMVSATSAIKKNPPDLHHGQCFRMRYDKHMIRGVKPPEPDWYEEDPDQYQ